jgi:type I restriction enzyme S subunit
MARQMKDSGIEWIGEIPTDWEIIQLKRYTQTNNGKEITLELDKDDFNAIPVYGSGGVFKYTDDYLYDGTSVMFGRKGTLGKPLYVNGKFWVVDTMYFLTYPCPEKLFPKYSFYELLVFDWQPHITQTALPSIVASEIVSCNFVVPPITQQKKISAYLDQQCAAIDAVLEKTRASIEEYKKLKQAVITEAVTKGVRGDRPMKDSGISTIKYGVSKVGSGKTPSGGATVYVSKGVLFLRSQNIYDTGLMLDNPTYISQDVDEEMKGTRVKPNDVLLNITGGSIGRCCIFPQGMGYANVNQHVSIIRVTEKIFSPDYMHYYWLSSLGKTAINLYQTGGNREGMSSAAIKNTPIPIIPREEMDEITEYLDFKCVEIDALIAKKEQFLTELENYKKSLIYEYVTGKREVH